MNAPSIANSDRSKIWVRGVILVLTILGLGFLSLPLFSKTGPEAFSTQCQNRMHLIGLALANYHADYGAFPPVYLTDGDGRPMHSWRVLILPYLDGKELYERYRFDEPWDGPNNSRLKDDSAAWAADTFHCPEDPSERSNTSYLAVIGPKTAWSETALTTSDVGHSDGKNQTLTVVESIDSGIHWMEPRDLEIETMNFKINGPPRKSARANHPLSFGWFSGRARCSHAVSVDGRVHCLSDETPPDDLRKLLIRDRGESSANRP